MNYRDHSRLSARKFGGTADDYVAVHRFLDSSKLFLYHIKHRLLLHNLFGVELAMELLGEFIENSAGRTILVRDVAAEHCREDLAGRVPTLYEWLADAHALEDAVQRLIPVPPDCGDAELDGFARKAFRRTGLHAALVLGYSDFGVHLVELFFGAERAATFANCLRPEWKIQTLLEHFHFTQAWQYSPQKKEIAWLKQDLDQSCENERGRPEPGSPALYVNRVRFNDLRLVLRIFLAGGLNLPEIEAMFHDGELRGEARRQVPGLTPLSVAEARQLPDAGQRAAALKFLIPEATQASGNGSMNINESPRRID